MEHAFPYRPQAITRLLVSGAGTRNYVHCVQKTRCLLEFLSKIADFLFTRLRPVGFLFNLMSGVSLTKRDLFHRGRRGNIVLSSNDILTVP